MSWSVTLIGKPEDVVAALEKKAESFDGMTRQEYDNALPHLIGLVKQNTGLSSPIRIAAAGHGWVTSGSPFNQCTVNLEILYGEMV